MSSMGYVKNDNGEVEKYFATAGKTINNNNYEITLTQEIKKEETYAFICDNKEFLEQFGTLLSEFFYKYNGKIIKNN